MSGPTGPFEGDEGEEELPWPQAEPPPADDAGAGARAAADDAAEVDEADGDDGGDATESRTGRRAARSARVRRRRRILAAIGGGLLVLVLAFVLWYELESHALGPEGPQVVVTVHEGESTSAIIDALNQHGVIGSSLAFQISEIIHGMPTVVPGSYALHQNLAFSEVRVLLAAGPDIYPVNVRPGFTLSEVAQEVDSLPGHARGGFEKTAASGAVHSVFSPPGSNNLEGMLGTGGYLVLPNESDTTILTDMVQRFDHDAQAAGLSTASAAAQGMTPYQVITVASIVEKEGYIPVNMPDTSRVIYNRLARGTPLQMDSTVLYALGQDGGPVTSQDLKIQSPYNTYLNNGLTPTPICMSSKDALEAAVHPPPGSWLYFVLVKKDGTMAFSDTYAEQLANEQLAKTRVDFPEVAADPGVTMDAARAEAGPEARLVGVIGSPIAHSLSPLLHNAAFAALGLRGTWTSLAFEVAPGQAASALAAMRRADVSGLSVTMPHKADVANLVDDCSEVARRLGAVNCIVNRDGLLLGTNTDGEGFVASLARGAGFTPAGKRCLVIGAGGAARAVVLALAEAGAREVAVLNRTPGRASTAAALAGAAGSVVPAGAAALAEGVEAADLVVNATPVGMAGASARGTDADAWLVAPQLLRPGQVAADLVYAPRPTQWLAAAAAAGAVAVDGLGMLVHQAAAQLVLWTGEDAPVEAMWRVAEAADPLTA